MSTPSSAALACERTAHPLLLHCLQDPGHDWRPLQLVNKSMCAAFRQHAVEVAYYTAQRERLRQDCAIMSAQLAALHDCWVPRCILDPGLLPRLIAEFEAMPWPPSLYTSEQTVQTVSQRSV
jgi:hypothetical protein